MSSENQPAGTPKGYRWWQWLLGFFLLPVLILMIVGVSSRRLRSKLSYGRIWIFCSVPLFIFFVCTVVIGVLVSEPETSRTQSQAGPRATATRTEPSKAVATQAASRSSTSKPAPTRPVPTAVPAKDEHPLVEEFGCQWILDSYRPFVSLGRDHAVLALATEMNLKVLEKNPNSLRHIGAGDAAAALRECE